MNLERTGAVINVQFHVIKAIVAKAGTTFILLEEETNIM